MPLVHANSFTTVSLKKGQTLELVDVFDVTGKKVIELASHSSFVYLIVASGAEIDIEIITKGAQCSCKIFGLFSSDIKYPISGSIKVILSHSQTSAEVELITFLYNGAKVSIDGSIIIGSGLDHVHGRLLEQNIILGKNIFIKTLPKLHIASYNVHASHGATIDSFDQQKLFYLMSRGLTKKQSERLLVNGYIDYVLSYFHDMSDDEKAYILDQIIDCEQ